MNYSFIFLFSANTRYTDKQLVYQIGNNAAEGENYIKYANSYLMNCTVNNCFAFYTLSLKLYISRKINKLLCDRSFCRV